MCLNLNFLYHNFKVYNIFIFPLGKWRTFGDITSNNSLKTPECHCVSCLFTKIMYLDSFVYSQSQLSSFLHFSESSLVLVKVLRLLYTLELLRHPVRNHQTSNQPCPCLSFCFCRIRMDPRKLHLGKFYWSGKHT